MGDREKPCHVCGAKDHEPYCSVEPSWRGRIAALAADYLRLREVEKAARGVHGLHMSLTSMAAPREFYDALWALDAALAALDQHRSKKP